MTARRKRGPGRPDLGRDGRTVVVSVKFSARELAAIQRVARPPLTASGLIREYTLAALGLTREE